MPWHISPKQERNVPNGRRDDVVFRKVRGGHIRCSSMRYTGLVRDEVFEDGGCDNASGFIQDLAP
jgi:hypothetical protein